MLFVAKLEEGKYFIGKTTKLSLAILNEDNGLGSPWTQRFKPTELLTIIELKEECCESFRNTHNEVTKIMMLKYGYENVRGGGFFRLEPGLHKNKVFNSLNLNEQIL